MQDQDQRQQLSYPKYICAYMFIVDYVYNTIFPT